MLKRQKEISKDEDKLIQDHVILGLSKKTRESQIQEYFEVIINSYNPTSHHTKKDKTGLGGAGQVGVDLPLGRFRHIKRLCLYPVQGPGGGAGGEH